MAYIGVSPSNGVRRGHTYTATASQTTFSGAGAEGTTLSYKDSNFVDVYQNGVKLGPSWPKLRLGAILEATWKRSSS